MHGLPHGRLMYTPAARGAAKASEDVQPKEKAMALWDKDFMPRPDLEKLQLRQLREVVAYVRQRVPFFRKEI